MYYVGQWGGGGPGHSWDLKWHERSECHLGPGVADEDVFLQFKEESKKQYSRIWSQFRDFVPEHDFELAPPDEDSFQCCGSMTFWGGSGSGSADPCLCLMDSDPDPDPRSGSFYFCHRPSRCQQKTNFLTQFFLLMTF